MRSPLDSIKTCSWITNMYHPLPVSTTVNSNATDILYTKRLQITACLFYGGFGNTHRNECTL